MTYVARDRGLVKIGAVALTLTLILASCGERRAEYPAECNAPDQSLGSDPAIESVTAHAVAWLNSLDQNLSSKVRYCLGDREMHAWTNVPGDRTGGIEMREMSRTQQDLAWDLVAGLMSESGVRKARLIATEITQAARATPLGSHTVVMFGSPQESRTWGLQVDGHHLALNFLVQGSGVILAPAFLGTQPLSVDGRAPLRDEARLGRDLIASFSAAERGMAQQDDVISRDVVVGSGGGQQDRGLQFNVSRFDGVGLPIRSLQNPAANVVNEIIDEYVNNLAEPFAGEVRAKIDVALHNGYVVYDTRNEDVYYRVYVPNYMLIEYNDVSSDHVHTVFRLLGDQDFSDYGAYAHRSHAPRTIAEHFETAPHHQIALEASTVSNR